MELIACPMCNGTGMLLTKSICNDCGGSGQRFIHVPRIPAVPTNAVCRE